MDIVCTSSWLDLISELPNNIIEIILMFLPLRDAARTSILSRRWRYQWTQLPMLVFDDDTFSAKLMKNSEAILTRIIEILFLHQGPISKFTLNISKLKSCLEIDKVILFLSRNGIPDFTLCMSQGECHKPPAYIFSCLQVRHFSLSYCVFKFPHTFDGFRKLITLNLWQVALDPVVTISSCPLLEKLALDSNTTIDSLSIDAPKLNFFWFSGTIKYIHDINTPVLQSLSSNLKADSLKAKNHIDLIEFFGRLPLLEELFIECIFLKFWAVHNVVGDLPKKLPIHLNYLSNLELYFICFTEMDEVLRVFFLIRSSPNLQKLIVEGHGNPTSNVEPVVDYIRMQNNFDVSLNKLFEVEVILLGDVYGDVYGYRPELEFIKFLLARSPELETMHITPASRKINKSGCKILIELTRFRRASQKAEIIFGGLDEDA